MDTLIKTAIHPRSKTTITFENNQHIYYTDKIKDFESVTGILDKWFEFDTIGIATKVATRRGILIEEVLAEWDKKKNDACELGTLVHEVGEMYMLKQPFPEIPPRMLPWVNSLLHFMPTIESNYDLVSTEMIVFSEELKIAGQIDLLVRNKLTKRYFILDYKTSKIIHNYNVFKKYAKAPLDYLDDINLVHYTLQLNMYKYLLLKEGYLETDDIGLGIIHIKPKIVKPITLIDMTKEIEIILNLR